MEDTLPKLLQEAENSIKAIQDRIQKVEEERGSLVQEILRLGGEVRAYKKLLAIKEKKPV
jgi:hypothetical protein